MISKNIDFLFKNIIIHYNISHYAKKKSQYKNSRRRATSSNS